MTDTVYKLGRELASGDTVKTKAGKWVTVTGVSKGMCKGMLLIEWLHPDGSADWGHVYPKDVVVMQ